MTAQVIPRRSVLKLLLVLVSGGLVGCDHDITIVNPTAPDPPEPIADQVEFRVLGTYDDVRIRHVNAQDGTSQVEADLPYRSVFTTLRDFVFLSLSAEAVGEGGGFLQVQIFVNGLLLQEANTSATDPRLAISVTYRRATPLPTPVPA
jgi:hypothetical protein